MESAYLEIEEIPSHGIFRKYYWLRVLCLVLYLYASEKYTYPILRILVAGWSPGLCMVYVRPYGNPPPPV